jgi:hypothetical protein
MKPNQNTPAGLEGRRYTIFVASDCKFGLEGRRYTIFVVSECNPGWRCRYTIFIMSAIVTNSRPSAL